MLPWISSLSAAVFLSILAVLAGRWSGAWRRRSAAVRASQARRQGWQYFDTLRPCADRFLPTPFRAYLQRLLSSTGWANEGWLPGHLAILQLLSGLLAGATAAALARWVGAGTEGMFYGLAMASGLGCWWPCQCLRERARQRQASLLRELPFVLDMATLCIEGGQNLQGALQQSALYGPPGPLRDELQHALADMRTGAPRIQALRAMAARAGVPALHSLVALLAQAEHVGMSIAPVLRAHAGQLRAERFLRAEKKALEAPVKMLLPLVTCIFPCTFVIIAFPIGQRIMQAGF